jgi:hypothetical protein
MNPDVGSVMSMEPDVCRTYRDDCDLVIEMLADSEAALLERVASLETDLREQEADTHIYREMASVATAMLAKAVYQRDRALALLFDWRDGFRHDENGDPR